MRVSTGSAESRHLQAVRDECRLVLSRDGWMLWFIAFLAIVQNALIPDFPDMLCGQGSDLTIVSWSAAAHAAGTACRGLAERGIEAELIDLRTLYPWDKDRVFESVGRTGRLLVVHEACRFMGFGAEIVAETAEEMFSALKAPPVRIGAPRIPVPFSESLEMLCRMTAPKVTAAAERLMTRSS